MNPLLEALANFENIKKEEKKEVKIDKSSPLYESLVNKTSRLSLNNMRRSEDVTNFYEKAIIEAINDVYPDKHWSEVFHGNIRTELHENNNDVNKVITKILMEAGEPDTQKPKKVKKQPKQLNEGLKNFRIFKDEKDDNFKIVDSHNNIVKSKDSKEVLKFPTEDEARDYALTESMSPEDFKSDLYNAIADVMFKYRDYVTERSQFESAFEWVLNKFFEDYESADEYEESLKEDIEDSNKDQCEVVLRELSSLINSLRGKYGNLKKKYISLVDRRASDRDYSQLVNEVTKLKLDIDRISVEEESLSEDVSDDEAYKRLKSGMSLGDALK